jgi:hypothetical protein
MNAAKRIFSVVALFAILLSAVPLASHAIYTYDPPPNPGSSSTWLVSCRYDAKGVPLGYTCSSGGPDVCGCP